MNFFNKLFGITPKNELLTLLQSGAVLLDVRSKDEYKHSHAPNSINIPLDILSKNLSSLDKEIPVVVVCQSGMRSTSAVSILKKNGFKEVYNGVSWTNFK